MTPALKVLVRFRRKLDNEILTKARRGMVDALKQNHFANVRKMVVIK